MDQKRVYKRVEDLVEVEFVSEASGVTTTMRTKTLDIGAGGVKVYLNHQLASGQEMELKIMLPAAKEQIVCNAEVITSDLVGVVGDKGQEALYMTRFKFSKIEMEDKNKITHHVYECRKRAHDAKSSE